VLNPNYSPNPNRKGRLTAGVAGMALAVGALAACANVDAEPPRTDMDSSAEAPQPSEPQAPERELKPVEEMTPSTFDPAEFNRILSEGGIDENAVLVDRTLLPVIETYLNNLVRVDDRESLEASSFTPDSNSPIVDELKRLVTRSLNLNEPQDIEFIVCENNNPNPECDPNSRTRLLPNPARFYEESSSYTEPRIGITQKIYVGPGQPYEFRSSTIEVPLEYTIDLNDNGEVYISAQQ